MIYRSRYLYIIRDLLGDFEKWLAYYIGKEIDLVLVILILSALILFE